MNDAHLVNAFHFGLNQLLFLQISKNVTIWKKGLSGW